MLTSIRARAHVLTLTVLAMAITAGCSKKEAAGCVRDTDCKGDRVCVSGTCAAAVTSSAAAPTPPSAAPVAVEAPAPAPERPSEPAPEPPATAAVVSPPAKYDRAIVRSAPSLDASTVTSLERGTEVSVIASEGAWRKIRWTTGGGGDGWIHDDVLHEPGEPAAKAAAPKAGAAGAPKSLDGCTRENQLCLLRGKTAGVCMRFGALACAIPPEFPGHHDGCKERGQSCRCSNTGAGGSCNLGPHKAGLYCRCD